MKVPKVVFEYSWIYDQNLKEWMKIYPSMRELPEISPKRVFGYISKTEKVWKRDEKKVLSELSRVSGLKWREDKIKCYVVNKSIPFSDPLTMPVYFKRPNTFVDGLIHELIHQLFSRGGNFKRSAKAWVYIYKKYKKEPITTRIHIPLHAIHEHIFRKFYSKKRLEQELEHVKKFKDYKRSWEIVQKDGYQNIIAEFRKRLR